MSKIKSSLSGLSPLQGAQPVENVGVAANGPFEQQQPTSNSDNGNTASDFTDTRVYSTMDTLIGKVPDGLFENTPVPSSYSLEPSQKAGSLASTSLSGLGTANSVTSLGSSTALSTPGFSLLKAEDTPFNTVPSLELSGDQATKELSAMSAKGGFSFEKTDSGSVKVALPMFGVQYTDTDIVPALPGNSKTFTFPSPADALNTARFSHWASAKGVKEVHHKGFKDHLQEDGIYGPRTQDAVRNFQVENNLPATGTVNKTTFSVLENIADKFGIRSWFWDDKKAPAPPKAVKPVTPSTPEPAPALERKPAVFGAPDQAGAAKKTTFQLFNPSTPKAGGADLQKSWQLSNALRKTVTTKEPGAKELREGTIELKRNDSKSSKLVERIQSLLNRIRARKKLSAEKKDEPVSLNIHGFNREDPETGQKILTYDYPAYIKNAFSSFRESVQANYNLRELHKAADHQQAQQIQDDIVRQQELDRFLQSQLNRKA